MKYNGQIHIVYDGMWGSCGKGKICGMLARDPKLNINVSVNNNMPNAGHTFYFDDGRKVVTHQLPIGIVNPNIKYLVIGESAAIDVDKLIYELDKYSDLIGDRVIYICNTACIVTEEHIKREKQRNKTGSTFTGCGEAVVSKIRREGNIVRDTERLLQLQEQGKIKIVKSKTFFPSLYHGVNGFNGNENILVECSQGDALSINSSSHPHTTSRDCTPAQAIKDIHATDYSANITKYCVIRPYPIRINNKPKNDRDDYMYTGDFQGAEEIDWDTVSKRSGVPIDEILNNEQSTTTHQTRRVAEFSARQFSEMLLDTNPDKIIINFAQYNDVELKNLTQDKTIATINDYNNGNMSMSNLEVLCALENLYAYIGLFELDFPMTEGKIRFLGTGKYESEIINVSKLPDFELPYEYKSCFKANALDYAKYNDDDINVDY